MTIKLDEIIATAKFYGWTGEIEEDDDFLTLEMNRHNEIVVMTWANSRLIQPYFYKNEEGFTFLKVPSQAIKMLQQPRNYETIIEPDLPFELDAEASTIIKAIRGRALVWRNTMTSKIETARVPPAYLAEGFKDGKKIKVWRTNKNIKITTTKAGRRILTWPALDGPYSCFRSIGLDQLLEVH